MPVTAPISAIELKLCRYRVLNASPSGELMKAGSAVVFAVFRWAARGRAIASGRLAPSSSRSSSTCSTVGGIVEPPGEPTPMRQPGA